MELKTLLDQNSKLPTIPRVAQQLITSFSSEDISIHAIAQQLSADAVLSAKVLRLANSAYFHLSRTVGTVDDAIRMLGFVMVRNLVLGFTTAQAFRHIQGVDLPQFWRCNLYTACAARWLAVRADANADLVFTVGLMLGIGQMHMHACIPQDMAALDARLHVLDAGRAALEREQLGFHYGEVAAELSKVWNFPAPIVQALRDVPFPLEAQPFSTVAACVHLGAWRARAEVLPRTPGAAPADYPQAISDRLGLTSEWAAQPAEAENPAAMPALALLSEGLDVLLE